MKIALKYLCSITVKYSNLFLICSVITTGQNRNPRNQRNQSRYTREYNTISKSIPSDAPPAYTVAPSAPPPYSHLK